MRSEADGPRAPRAHLRTRGALRHLLIVGCIAVVSTTAGCSSGANSSRAVASTRKGQPHVTNAPRGIYLPPNPLKRSAPGTLIRREPVEGLPLHLPTKVWRILYHSRSSDGRDVAVSGFALVPLDGHMGARPVYAWAHGTVGLGDQCAPSHTIRNNLPPYGGQQLDRGAVLVASDYQGLGTPGVPNYADGVADAQAVLDSVRAVAELPGVGALGDVVLAGHSQGGPAVLLASEIGSTYAPDLRLKGVVALAPGDVLALVDRLAASPYKGLALMGAAGLRAAHPDVDLTKGLSANAIGDLHQIERECVDTTVARYRTTPSGTLFRRPPSAVPVVRRFLERSSPGTALPAGPVFIGHGGDDQQVPLDVSEGLAGQYCGLGGDVTRRIYQRADHDRVIEAAADDALAFISARFDHRPTVGGCP